MSTTLALNAPPPEWLFLANTYLETQDIKETAQAIGVAPDLVTDVLGRPEVKRYLDQIYLDMGYRNRHKLAALLDKIIENKVDEATESGMYTNKDLVDLIALQHKMRMEELKASQASQAPLVQINTQNNYSSLVEELMSGN